jgi:hypothetical protein
MQNKDNTEIQYAVQNLRKKDQSQNSILEAMERQGYVTPKRQRCPMTKGCIETLGREWLNFS